MRQQGLPSFPTQKTAEVLTGLQQESTLTSSLVKYNSIKGPEMALFSFHKVIEKVKFLIIRIGGWNSQTFYPHV